MCLCRRHSSDPQACIVDMNTLYACRARFYFELEISEILIPRTRISGLALFERKFRFKGIFLKNLFLSGEHFFMFRRGSFVRTGWLLEKSPEL